MSLGAGVFDEESDADGEPDVERERLGDVLTLPVTQAEWDFVNVEVPFPLTVEDGEAHTVGVTVENMLAVNDTDKEDVAHDEEKIETDGELE